MKRSSDLSRREALALGLFAVTLTGCVADPDSSTTPPTRAQAASTIVPSDIAALLSTTPFMIAHRGSGDNWVEHTLDAYTRSIEMGAKAIEVSVSSTSDGVLVCHHDTSTERMTGSDRQIGDVTYAELSLLRNDNRGWLGPATELQPIPRLSDVLDAFAATHVILLEDKQGTNTDALLDLMDSFSGSTSHLIWKQWAGAGQYGAARDRGYTTWGYFTADILDRAEELAPRFDLLGVSHTASDTEVSRIVSFGKPVIAWEVHYRSVVQRMQRLGVAGMMCSNLPYITGSSAPSPEDGFSTGIRQAGDLPWSIDQGSSLQPRIDSTVGSAIIAGAEPSSYLMGSMCPVKLHSSTIRFQLRWPDQLPGSMEHCGLAFGLADDRPYRIRVVSDTSGYHLILRANGSLELFSRAAGTLDGTLLAKLSTTPPVLDEWVSLGVSISEQAIEISRYDTVGWSETIEDADYRGGYFWLTKNYPGGPSVEFRDVTVNDQS